MSKRSLVYLMGSLVFLFAGCQTQKTELTQIRNVLNEIEDTRLKAVFLAAVGEAEGQESKGNMAAAARLLSGVSQLAYSARDRLSPGIVVETITAVKAQLESDRFEQAILPPFLSLWSFPDRRCNLQTKACDIWDDEWDCWEIWAWPDTITVGCISMKKL